jgi:hypothetical protein
MCYNPNKEKIMNNQLQPGNQVTDTTTGETGRLLGSFTRRGEKWWTIHWEGGETTAQPEEGMK